MWLITGAAGFIGTCLVADLLKNTKEILLVRDLDFRSSPAWFLMSITYTDRIKFATSDYMADIDSENLKGIIHLGAITDTMCEDVAALTRTNVLRTLELFDIATKRNIPFIYASSASVYGNGDGPLSAYGKSKLNSEIYMLDKIRKPDRWYFLRLFNVYGPNEDHKGSQRSMVSQAHDQITNGGKLRLFKEKANRDFVYVKDVVDCIKRLMKRKVKSGVYDLGSGKQRSFDEMAKIAFKVLDVKPKIERFKMPDGLKNQYQKNTKAKMDKLFKASKWKPKWSLEDGIRDYFENYK